MYVFMFSLVLSSDNQEELSTIFTRLYVHMYNNKLHFTLYIMFNIVFLGSELSPPL